MVMKNAVYKVVRTTAIKVK